MMQDLAHALEKSGWVVTVLATGTKKGIQENKGLTVHRLKAPKNHQSAVASIIIWLKLYFKAMGMPRHDVVITLTDPPMMSVMGKWIAGAKKSAHIHWCQDLYPDLFRPLGVYLPKFIERFLLKLSRRAMNQANKVVVVGQCMGKLLTKTGVAPPKIMMIANWADLEVVAPLQGKPRDYANIQINGTAKKPEEMFCDDSPKFRVLYAGNIGRAHPMKSVIEAADLLREHEEIEFVFVGDQSCHARLMRERGKRGLENIKFMPYQPIELLRGVMESGDLHLVTMRDNVKGMLVPCKFYSGLTVGRPTLYVGPEKTEIADVITNYNAGAVVATDDPQTLADMIYGYRTDGEAWFAAQEGALRAAQAYHPNQSLHKWAELMEKARFAGR
jgi:glycosyltransferase involved in cell wall biosynthesis